MIFPRRNRDPSAAADLAAREDPYNEAQASRIYVLPNLMTAGNLFCGFMAVVNCIHARLAGTADDGLYLAATAGDHYRYAVYFIFGAALFDMLDGRLARMGGRESLFGAEFDSLADVVSFGMAPAFLMFFLILSPSQEFPWFRDIGGGIGFFYLLCAAMRLARFNVMTNPLLHRGKKESNKDFIGLPVPAAAGTVAAIVLFLLKLGDDDKSLNKFALVLPFLMVLIAFLMMSTVRYPSGKNVDLQTQTRFRTLVALLALIGLGIIFKEVVLLALFLGYIFFGLIRHWRKPRPARIVH
ncbi:MAG TPA: CDP-diacylglycerol--serine O-phosphatidyltransferase [Opitutaceae bacterium]|nr:CDP-diacylglycerol--serine O-phosphatidyltransferase [Opitutaceae bacterium]